MSCQKRREGDEFVCPVCDIRYGADELIESPSMAICRKTLNTQPKRDALVVRIAKCIIGPRQDTWIGPEKLQQLRDHKWDAMASRAEKSDAVLAAQAILKEIGIDYDQKPT